MSPTYNLLRSPDHHAGPPGGGYYGKGHHHHPGKHQSKLPHGLTVQELKEMTRARLAAEAEVGGPEGNGSSDQSVHSAGTRGSSKESADRIPSAPGRGGSNESSAASAATRNLLRENEARRRESGGPGGRPQGFAAQGQQQQMQQQNAPPPPPPYNAYPRGPSPTFGQAPPPPVQFGGRNGSCSRGASPSFLAPGAPQGDTWETASAASAEYPDAGYRPAGSQLLFQSPNANAGDSNAVHFNRGRCFSAGATAVVPSSLYERQHAALMYSAPLTTGSAGVASGSNRQRCATASPPGMSRLHEDRPFLFSNDDKERLAIPPLSEPRPRPRLHTTGGLGAHLGGGTAASSAFVPVAGKQHSSLPQSPMGVSRAKFGVGDRTLSTGSAASGHGDLPSSMAEAVLASITSNPGGPIGGTVIGGHGSSPFRPSMASERDAVVGDHSPYRVGQSSSSENASSAFRADALLQENSGSLSLFSGAEPAGGRNLFSAESSSERMLLGTQSWAGAIEDENGGAHHSDGAGISHDFSNLLSLSGGPALRGRAATEPAWFGGIDPFLVSRIDPEHKGEARETGPQRVSSVVDLNNAASSYNVHGEQQNMSFDGFK